MSDPIRTRFAPSPTGFLHIGGVRTALYNWLLARKMGGKFVLRIDDTDTGRNVQEALQPILDGFKWLGLNWDEGPEVDGPYGPYYQSQRTKIYQGYFAILQSRNEVYQDKGAWRLKMQTGDQQLMIDDLVRGRVTWDVKNLTHRGDPVIVRSDGTFLYNFATVCDDHDMKITHVLRAEEHLSNTPVQLKIYEALGMKPPLFGHLPFVCSPGSKKKLSKRDAVPVTVEYYKNVGYTQSGILNYLALLGWSLDDRTELFTLQELIDGFSIKGIHNAPASFDPKKMLHINAEHMKLLPNVKVDRCADHLRSLGIEPDMEMVKKVVEACGDRIKTFNDISGYGIFFFRDPEYNEEAFQKRLGGEHFDPAYKFVLGIKEVTPFDSKTLEAKLHEYCEQNGLKVGDMVHAIRIAITGQPIGPGVFDCLSILGPDESVRRFNMAWRKKRGL
jgi:glutamyl-tRNA synthetase